MSGAADHKHMGPASISGPSLAATVLVDLIKRVDVLQLDRHHRLAALRLIDELEEIPDLIMSMSIGTCAEMRLGGDMPARGDACAHENGGVDLCVRSLQTVFEFDKLCYVSSLSGAADRVGAASGPSLAANELDSTSIDDENDLDELPDLVEELEDVPVFGSAYEWQEA